MSPQPGGTHLLLRHDKAGDALKSLPALRAARKAHTTDAFHLLVSPHNFSVLEHEPGFSVHCLPKGWEQSSDGAILSHLHNAGLPLRLDSAISLLCDPFDSTARLLALVPAAKKYSCPGLRQAPGSGWEELPLPDASPAQRDETLNIALLLSAALGSELTAATAAASRAPVLIPADNEEALRSMGPKNGLWVGFCPFAGLQHRSAPLHRWERFLDRAVRTVYAEHYFIFGTRSDWSAMQTLRNACPDPKRVELCTPTSFRALGAYLLRLDAVVAVDSGPLHLARALDLRALGILSGGDVKRWFPDSGAGQALLHRGLFQRFPTAWEMGYALRKWWRTLDLPRHT